MTDRAFALLAILGLLLVMLARPAMADDQPDITPDTRATTSAPVSDRDTGVPDDPEDTLEDAYDAVRAGRWLVAAGLVLWALVAGLRRISARLGGRVAWLATDRGGAVLALSLAFLAEVALLLASGRSPSISGFTGAAAAAFVAAGGRNVVSRILRPRDGAPAVL